MKECISIIMPAYNAEKTIKTSIDSILAQTFTDFKLYIVNDASSDETHSIIESYTDKRIVNIKNELNLGVANSRNKAISQCEGTFIAFLDSDDTWHFNKLTLQHEMLYSGWDVVSSNYTTFINDPLDVKGHRVSPTNISYKNMLYSNYVGNLTGIYNANKLGKVYQQNIGHEDYVMWLEVIKRAGNCYCIQKELASYRLSPNSLSGNKLKAIFWQWDIYRKTLNFGIFRSAYYFAYYIFHAIAKRK